MSQEGAPDGRALIEHLRVHNFRNLSEAVLTPASHFNLIFGENGHGKTSLIEALYVGCTTKSFRSQRLSDAIKEGETEAAVTLSARTLGLTRELRARVGARSRSFLIDGKKPKSQLTYALATPVIAFHPGDLTLASGPASVRRNLLDRILVHQDPAGAKARQRYQRAVRERQKLLSEPRTSEAQLTAYEEIIADSGSRYSEGRAYVAKSVEEALLPAFEKMASPGLACRLIYEPGGTGDRDAFVRALAASRVRDRARGAANFGPHRDELRAELAGRPARSHASQGQQRVLALAFKMAELACIREVTQMEPILLLDDVSSELDPARTSAVFDFLREERSQIFVTTTRPELFVDVHGRSSGRADFWVQNGSLVRR